MTTSAEWEPSSTSGSTLGLRSTPLHSTSHSLLPDFLRAAALTPALTLWAPASFEHEQMNNWCVLHTPELDSPHTDYELDCDWDSECALESWCPDPPAVDSICFKVKSFSCIPTFYLKLVKSSQEVKKIVHSFHVPFTQLPPMRKFDLDIIHYLKKSRILTVNL